MVAPAIDESLRVPVASSHPGSYSAPGAMTSPGSARWSNRWTLRASGHRFDGTHGYVPADLSDRHQRLQTSTSRTNCPGTTENSAMRRRRSATVTSPPNSPCSKR